MRASRAEERTPASRSPASTPGPRSIIPYPLSPIPYPLAAVNGLHLVVEPLEAGLNVGTAGDLLQRGNDEGGGGIVERAVGRRPHGRDHVVDERLVDRV